MIVAFEGTGSSDHFCLLCCETRQTQLADTTIATCLLKTFSVHVFLVSHPYRRNLQSPHVDLQQYAFFEYFRSDLRISLGASAGESSLCPVRSGCAAVQPLCEIQGLRGHAACSIFLAVLEGSCRDRSNAEADRYRCVILTATGRFGTDLVFCIRNG